LCGEDELPFVTGGAEIYRIAIPLVNEIHLTRVHTEIDGDTKLPEIDWDDWTLIEEFHFQKDEKNSFDYSFQTFSRS
jgi:dihydrofolate reductase